MKKQYKIENMDPFEWETPEVVLKKKNLAWCFQIFS